MELDFIYSQTIDSKYRYYFGDVTKFATFARY